MEPMVLEVAFDTLFFVCMLFVYLKHCALFYDPGPLMHVPAMLLG